MSAKSATSRAGKPSANPPQGKASAKSKTGKLPEWNLADLYSGIGAVEVTCDLQKMDADCAAFETDYKGRLAERIAGDDGGRWLAEAVRRYEAIDDLADGSAPMPASSMPATVSILISPSSTAMFRSG